MDAKRDSMAPNAATRPKKRAARVGADNRTLERERAGTSMFFGNLGASAGRVHQRADRLPRSLPGLLRVTPR
jgi:hypothetical protein